MQLLLFHMNCMNFSLWGKEDEKEITADIEEDISFLMEQGFLTEKKKISSIKHYETDTLKDLYIRD